jgi:hypothetical protein
VTDRMSRAARFYLVPDTQTAEKIPNVHKIYKMEITYTKWPNNIPNGQIIYRHFPFQGPPNLTKIGIFGIKMFHLAPLRPSHKSVTPFKLCLFFQRPFSKVEHDQCQDRNKFTIFGRKRRFRQNSKASFFPSFIFYCVSVCLYICIYACMYA